MQYSPSSGQPQTFTYDASCMLSSGGWHYDNATMPTKIVLCPSTCTAVQADAGASIDIVLGCATKGGVK